MKHWILPACMSLCALTVGWSRADAQEVPAATVLELRLRDPVSTFHAKRGDVFHAVLIAPVPQGSHELLPAGLEVNGHVAVAKCVGLGLVRERARLRLQFDSLVLPGGISIPLEGRVIEVENARESLLNDGTIVGVRATDSYGHQATGMVSSVAAFDPMLMLFAFAGSSAVLRFPEAEITYPSGTELRLRLLKPLPLGNAPSAAPAQAEEAADAERASLEFFVNELPDRTHTKGKNTRSDLTNLVFLGSRAALLRAFAAAGWKLADDRDSATEYETVRALAESRGYAEAPVSVLLLDGKPPSFVFEKTLNTISKRHHLRVWRIDENWNGQMIWTAAATHDIGLGFSSRKTVIHRVDANIDEEREKVANDLQFAGCTGIPEMIERQRVPRITQNGTGERMVTDGRVAVLHLRDCARPDERVLGVRRGQASHTGNPVYRAVRQFDLTLRNSLLRDNMAWQAYGVSRTIWKISHHHSEPPRAASLFPVSEEESEPHLAVAGDSPSGENFRETPRPRLPEVAFSLDGGEFFRLHLGDLYLASVDPTTSIESVYQFPMRIEPGAMLGSSVTLHPSSLLSHEIYFGTLQANLLTGDDPGPQVDRIRMRMAGYQLEGNLAPRRWRLRPFLSVGGSLATYKFKNIKLAKKDGVFKFALRRVGTIVSAFNSAGVASLDGGSIFQPAFTYGSGLKFRITRLLEFQAEYRENYAKDPDFFNKQSLSLSSQGITSAQDPGSRRHSAYLLSLSFTP